MLKSILFFRAPLKFLLRWIVIFIYFFISFYIFERKTNNKNSYFFYKKGLFKGFSIAEIEETTLDGNLFKSDSVKLNWKSTDKDVDANFDYHTSPSTSLERIKLMPMEIRTFIIKLFAN